MLLARTAESAYWSGRYLERAEGMARVVLVHGDAHVDLPVGEDVGWGPLLAIAGVEEAFAESQRLPRPRGSSRADRHAHPEGEVVEFLLFDTDNPSSVLASVAGAREALRLARSVVPRRVWELGNELWLELTERRGELHTRDGRVRWLRQVIADCERVNGQLWGAMRRDEALAFIRMGQHLERADLTCRVLEARADSAVAEVARDAYDEVRSMAVLRALAAYQPFRRAMPARPLEGSTLDFLLHDESFPRAVAACLSEIRGYLKDLPHNDEALAACSDASVRLAGTPVGRLSASELRGFMAELQPMLRVLHERLQATYFEGAPVARTVTTRRPAGTSTEPAATRPGRPARSDAPAPRCYAVTHRTTYRYEAPAEQSYNEAHLRPRDTPVQQCLRHDLEVSPVPVSWSGHTDSFGNPVTTFVVRGGFETLSVTSRSEVAVRRVPEPPPGPPWETVRSVLDRDRRAETRDARQYRTPSRLVPSSSQLAAYALESFRPTRPFVEAVVELSSRIHRDFAYEPGFTSVTTPVLEVFEARRGVCQDFAHLAVGCLRAVDLAARYVSGYIESTPGSEGDAVVAADASHAWVSTYLPGWGWIDVDPTNDQLVADGHVTTAWGLDYGDVSPLRGTVEGGGTSHTLEVAVEVVPRPTETDGAIG